MIVVAVTLLLHTTVPLQPVAVSIALSPSHSFGLVLAITGVDGESPGVTIPALDA